MNARRLTLTGLATLAVLAASSASAWAGVGHGFSDSFGPGGPGVGVFENVQGVAVDQSTDDVYVYDLEYVEAREAYGVFVHKFNSSGEPQDFSALGASVIEGSGEAYGGLSQIAVDSSGGPAGGDIYVVEGERVTIYGEDGDRLGELNSEVEADGGPWGLTCGVAVDPAGNVYVGLYEGHVNQYAPSGNSVSDSDYVSSLAGLPEGSCDLAADSEGNVYVNTLEGPVRKYEALQFGSLEASGTEIDEHGGTLTVDPLTDELFVDDGSDVAQYDSSGNLLATFGQSGPGALGYGSYGVAVNDTAGEVYVSNAESADVEIFRPGPTPPAPSTDPASPVTGTSATLHGELNPEGEELEFYFSYNQGTSCTGPNSITTPLDNEGEPATGTSTVQESAQIEQLEGNTQYAFCLVTQNAFGSTPGSSLQFTTSQIKPTIASESGSADSPTEAALSAEIIPGNLDTHYHFEYGTEAPEYGQGAPIPDADLGSTPTTVSQTIHGLQPGTIYHYRVVVTNSVGTEEGPDQTLETPPLAPVVTFGQATNITTTTATLPATIEPNGADTTYHFYYFNTLECPLINNEIKKFFDEECPTGVKTPSSPEGDAGTSPSTVTAGLTGLQPGTTYTYWLDAHNAGGFAFHSFTGNGWEARLTFTTLPLPPVVSAQPATDVGTTTATGVGIIDTQAGDITGESIYQTTYHFEYGLTASYGAVSPVPDADAGSGDVSLVVGAPFVGLQPGTIYHYRVVAVNAGGTFYGPDETFITRASYVTAPSAITAGTSALATTSVTLDGALNPQGAETLYRFEYGTGTGYGSVVPAPNADAGSESTALAVSEGLTGLQPGTTYHYRLVANNTGGTTYGEDQNFTTAGTAPSGPPSTVTVFPDVSSLTPTPPVRSTPTQTKALPKPTRTEKLMKALKQCKKDKNKKKKMSCERTARKKVRHEGIKKHKVRK